MDITYLYLEDGTVVWQSFGQVAAGFLTILEMGFVLQYMNNYKPVLYSFLSTSTQLPLFH